MGRPAASAHPLDGPLAAAALGEAWALRLLYDTLAPKVVGYLRGRGASEPEDLASDVFLTVFGRLASVTGGGAGLSTFTFSVAHARLVDDFRRRSRSPVTVEFDPRIDAGATASAEDVAAENLGNAAVLALLDRLPDSQREVLLLRVVADLTVEQVAAAIGRSEGAVKQLQRRALEALRGLVSAAGVPL